MHVDWFWYLFNKSARIAQLKTIWKKILYFLTFKATVCLVILSWTNTKFWLRERLMKDQTPNYNRYHIFLLHDKNILKAKINHTVLHCISLFMNPISQGFCDPTHTHRGLQEVLVTRGRMAVGVIWRVALLCVKRDKVSHYLSLSRWFAQVTAPIIHMWNIFFRM